MNTPFISYGSLCTKKDKKWTDFVATYMVETIAVPTFAASVSMLSINNWIVIQQRLDSSLNFNQNWTAYKNGFGTISGKLFV